MPHQDHPIKASRRRRKAIVIRNLLRTSLVISALIIGHDFLSGQRAVQAVKIKGLIYNRDGKFIYRPPRANQAHIIVIDDRSPKSSSDEGSANNKTDSNKLASNTSNNQDASASQINPGLLQLLAPQQLALRGIYPAGAGQFRLIGLNDLQSMSQQPQLKAQISARVSQAQPPLPQGFMPHAGVGGIQMVPLIQLVPHTAIAGMNPRTGQPDAPMGQAPMLYPTNVDQMGGYAQATGESGPVAADPYLEQQQMARASGYEAQQAYYQPAVRQRYAPNYGEPASPYAGPMQMYPDYPQQRMEPAAGEPSLFDEQLANGRGGSGGSPYISQLSHQQMLKSRRPSASIASGPPVQDLDDVEGDHVEYYDADMRGATRSSYGGRGSGAYAGSRQRQYFSKPSPYGPDSSLADDGSGGYQRQHNGVAFAGMSEGPAPRSSNVPAASQQSTTLGAIPGSTHDSRPLSLKMKLDASGSARTKNSSLKLSRGKQQGTPTIGTLDEPTTGVEAKDPKSLQYWKQYQDQFDIV